MKTKAMVITYGCQMNEHDSEVVKKYLFDLNYGFTEDINEADVIIINTCCVRESAEKRIYGRASYLRKYKYKKPGLIIGLIGCLVQKDKKKVLEKVQHIDFILGPQEINKIPEVLKKVKMGRAYIGSFEEKDYIGYGDKIIPENPYKAWLAIMKGCNNFCSYCIVPYVRGREVSKNIEIIKEEFKYLQSIGIKDVTLLGQNVNSYGKNSKQHMKFSLLLTELDKMDLIPRIRFVTSHPKDFDFGITEAISNGKNLCPHIHLPVQSGSDRILKKMNRGYNIKEYREKVAYIRKKIPDVSITTDIIIGFPGETRKDFEQTLSLLSDIEFDSAHTFIYSERSGTKAAGYSDKIDEDIKKKRIRELINLQNEISLKVNKKLTGKTYKILIEGMDKKKMMMQGRTPSNKIVLVPLDESLLGKIVDVKIKEGTHWTLFGDILNVK
ncbi:MAG: tRNA (N6-isopentenyl adenosine(37)-C2)-methylthiotransferase MiaB [Candidatus Muiribacteriota bacterium]